MEKILEVKNLSVDYAGARSVKALKDVSFDVKKGEILGIIGESGSGKSTLAVSVLNLLPENAKTEGEVNFKGRNILDLSESDLCRIRGKEIGLVMQDPSAAFNPVLTIKYQFEEFLKVKGICKNKEEMTHLIDESLKRVSLNESLRILKSYPHQLSGGQLQRVMIALIISASPDLLIADEPTSSLDVTIESQLVHMFSKLRDELGLTIIFITHNIGLLGVLCDRIVVLYRGCVCERGDKSQIMINPQDPYTKELIDSVKKIEG